MLSFAFGLQVYAIPLDYYDRLGIDWTTRPPMAAIQRAYEAKVRIAISDAERSSLLEAYEHLSLPSRRMAYDRLLEGNKQTLEPHRPEVKVANEHERLLREFGRVSFSQPYDDGIAVQPKSGHQALPANPMSDNAYERLGLPVEATDQEIRAARRAGILKYHADLDGGSGSVGSKSHEFTARINDAADQLLNPASRARVPGPGLKVTNEKTQNLGIFADEAKGDDIRARLKRLAAKNKAFSEFIMAVLDWSVGLERKGFRILPTVPVIDPADSKLIAFIMDSKDQVLLTALIDNLLDKSWSEKANQAKTDSLLKQIINLENRVLNNYIAEMIVAPWWINARGAEILSMLLDRGHYFQVARSLHLGGFLHSTKNGRRTRTTWVSHPKGVELMMRIFKEASEYALWQIDNSFFGQSQEAGVFIPFDDLVWPAALKKVDARIGRAPYVSGHSLRALGIVQPGPKDGAKEIGCVLRLTFGGEDPSH